jgi:lipopolysaccharide/colanic/teichoic acid biosynthesis glycosyltransferase
MGYGNCVLVNDTPSNLEVIGEAGFSYSGQERERHLYQQLQMLLSQPQLVEVYRRKAFERARQNFRWDMVVADHELFYKNQFCRQDTTSSTQHGRSPEALFISTAKKSSLRGDLKRAIDIAGATVGLLLLAPIFLVISIIVALSSPGPVFYRWKVVGKDGRNFVSYKFRSMFQDADERKAELLNNNEMSGPVFKMTADPRITPIGRFLRKYSVDEIPQLWSVLKGDMSLVGPRPPLQSEYEQFSERQKLKLQVKPGMTCLWQVKGRNEIANFDDWVRLDLEYINNWSLSLDFKILMSTIPAVLFGKGR